MPARNKRRIERKRSTRSFKRFKLTSLLIFSLMISLAFIYIKKDTRHWDGRSKLSLAIVKKDGDLLISTFDPLQNEIIYINIPGNTEVEVAGNLGVWKLRSVSELADNEGLDNSLITSTIVKNFKFPVYLWASTELEVFNDLNISDVFSAVFKPIDTNLGIGDRLQLALFSFQIKPQNKVNIRLEETNYIKRTIFVDEEEGYRISNNLSGNLLTVFTDNDIANESLKVIVSDISGKDMDKEVAQVVEVMGAKVIIKKQEKQLKGDCLVTGRKKSVSERFANVFKCDVGNNGNADDEYQIILGEGFSRRF